MTQAVSRGKFLQTAAVAASGGGRRAKGRKDKGLLRGPGKHTHTKAVDEVAERGREVVAVRRAAEEAVVEPAAAQSTRMANVLWADALRLARCIMALPLPTPWLNCRLRIRCSDGRHCAPWGQETLAFGPGCISAGLHSRERRTRSAAARAGATSGGHHSAAGGDHLTLGDMDGRLPARPARRGR